MIIGVPSSVLESLTLGHAPCRYLFPLSIRLDRFGPAFPPVNEKPGVRVGVDIPHIPPFLGTSVSLSTTRPAAQ